MGGIMKQKELQAEKRQETPKMKKEAEGGTEEEGGAKREDIEEGEKHKPKEWTTSPGIKAGNWGIHPSDPEEIEEATEEETP